MADQIFANSKCNITPIDRIPDLPLLDDVTIPEPPTDISSCFSQPILPLPDEFPCPDFAVRSGSVYVGTGPNGESISAPSFTFGLSKNSCCGFVLSAELRLPTLNCPDIQGSVGPVYVGRDEHGESIHSPSIQINVTKHSGCKFDIIGSLYLPPLNILYPGADFSGSCPTFSQTGSTVTFGNMTATLPSGTSTVTFTKGDTCSFGFSTNLQINAKMMALVSTPSTLPGSYNGDIALLGKVRERSGSTGGGGYAGGGIGGNTGTDVGDVWIIAANGIPLNPAQFYNAREAGSMTQGGVTHPLYLVDNVEAVVRTPDSIASSWFGDTPLLGTFILRNPADDTDIPAGPVYIRDLNMAVLSAGTKYQAVWSGLFTQDTVTLILAQVEVGAAGVPESGRVSGVYCSGNRLYVAWG